MNLSWTIILSSDEAINIKHVSQGGLSFLSIYVSNPPTKTTARLEKHGPGRKKRRLISIRKTVTWKSCVVVSNLVYESILSQYTQSKFTLRKEC